MGIHCQCPSRQIHSGVAWRPKPVLIGLSMSAVLCLLGFVLLLEAWKTRPLTDSHNT
ncbi:hypothetical protein BDV34DRAFT_195867, partial [Aspergillus parasiticus]